MLSNPFPTVPEISAPNAECQNPKMWSMYDGMATEVETLQFLYSLVRLLKPSVIVETGSYKGYGTYWLARACKEMKHGFVFTCEINQELCHHTFALLQHEGVIDRVSISADPGDAMIRRLSGPIDFAFLDSNLDTRIGEMRELYHKLTPGGVVAVHDTSTYHDQPGHLGPRTPMLQLARQYNMQVINLDTPRGLMLLRKAPSV